MKHSFVRCAGVCLLLALCLTACGEKGGDSSATTQTTAATTVTTPAVTTESTVTSTAATTTAPQVSDDTTTTTTATNGVAAMQDFVKTERVNGIAIGMTEAEVLAVCGEPSEKCEPKDTNAGTTQEYRFGSRTNYVIFARENTGALTVQEYAFKEFQTASGIQNGATRAAVIATYQKNGLKPDTSLEEGATLETAETLYVGDWRVSTMRFRFTGDTLTKIYVTGGAVG